MKRVLCGLCLMVLLSSHAWAKNNQGVDVHVMAKTTTSWNGKPLPAYPPGQPEITILRILIPPGVQLPLHEHPVINAGVLLKGQLTVVTENHETLHLKAGDSIVEVVNTWHDGRNDGTEPAEIIVFYAGIAGKPITLLKQGTAGSH